MTTTESTVRIVLLGKSVSENSRVGNILLGRAAFDSEAPPDVVERVGGRLKDRHVMVINSPQLLQKNISDNQITQIVRECVYLSDPGPHVIVLLLKHDQCSAEDEECVEKVLDSFSEQVFQHTMVLTTQEPNEANDILQKIIQKCFNRHFSLQRRSSPDDLLQVFEDIVQMNDGRHLVCAEASQDFPTKQQATERFSERVKLNLVVCGSDGTLKSSISERILQQTDVELHGRLVSLVELPALFNTRLSEEEVMHQTVHCVSLCDPGVHVFLFIIPDSPLNNEDKAEMEKIQRIFSSRIKKHIMILIMQNSEHQTAELNGEMKTVVESFGGRHSFFGPTTQVSTLMENVEQMLKENRQEFFSTETFFDVQMKKLLQYEEKKKIHSLETYLLSDSAESEDDLRIVLLGKTGVGKSATGNTILGRDVFKAELSHQSITKESQRETSETNGRHITVIDTPGLFDTELTNEEIQREISNCISMILPGPHVFIIVLNLGQRFTQEEATSVKIIQETFGQNSLMFTMVLFTRGDYLKNKTIEEFIGKPGSLIKNLIEECGNRFHVFNNNQTGDRTQVSDLLEKIDAMVRANGGSFYSCKRFRQMEREKQEQQMNILMERVEQLNREREELMNKLEEKERMKIIMEEERQNHDKEQKRRKEEDKNRREREKYISDEQIQRLKSKMEGIIREKERIERERQEQLEVVEKRLKEERNMREAQQATFNDKLKFIEKQHEEEQKHFEEKMKYYEYYEDELKRRRVEWREECEREKENMIKKFCTETDTSLQNKAYRRLEIEFSKWTWSLRSAMMETEIKLHNKIENEAIHEVEETDLQRELKKTSEEVNKSMIEFFEKDKDKDIVIQWKTSFEIRIKELQENIVRETKRKLNEILQQRDLKKKIDAQRTQHENTLLEKSKELALKLKEKTNDEETLKKEFDLFWEQSVRKIIRDTPPIKDIDIMRDLKLFLNDTYESIHVNPWNLNNENYNILSLHTFAKYIKFKKSKKAFKSVNRTIKAIKSTTGFTPSKEDEDSIKSLVSDISQQTDKMIKSFNIANMGYNITYIQELLDYIKRRVTEHQEGPVDYVFKNEFIMDLTLSIFQKANNTFIDQHRVFREANDPIIYVEKKREEYYNIFQKYCHGAASAAIFGQIICQKLKEPVEQSVYKKTARDLADEIMKNCEPLNGSRSKLEKHILTFLAQADSFGMYMMYINFPKDFFKIFISVKVNRYITDKFSVSVLPKIKENIKLMQQKILTAVREATEHVQVNSGDVGLWLKSFTQQLSDVLIFSEKDLSGVKQDDVDDFNLLEDVTRKELTAIISDISSKFNTETFGEKLDCKFRPNELLIDHFCQCCWAQCPFCGATCTNTIENHHGDHSVPFHRVNALNGWHYKISKNLCTDFCTTLVASDRYFINSDESVPHKDYRKAGGEYAKWSITPDLSELPYWKWFICRFKKDLEEFYRNTFDGRGKIPDEWRMYSMEDAIESLDKYI